MLVLSKRILAFKSEFCLFGLSLIALTTAAGCFGSADVEPPDPTGERKAQSESAGDMPSATKKFKNRDADMGSGH